MRALVTGGTGFVGSNLVHRLHQDGWEVLYTGPETENRVPGTRVGNSIRLLPWDGIGRIDVLFHQAAITDTLVTDPVEMFKVNTVAPLGLFADAIRHGCRRIVYASSCATYGDSPPPFREDGPTAPLNVYGQSKLLLDVLAATLADKATITGLRYSNVYGPGEAHKGRMASMVWQLAGQLRRGENPRLFEHGQQKRDFVYVEDVVAANLRAAEAGVSGVFNCGSGTANSFSHLLAVLQRALGTDRPVQWVPNPHPAGYQVLTLCDMRNAAGLLGHVPRYSLEEGIRDYVVRAAL